MSEPSRFGDIVGQDLAIAVLRASLTSGRLAHAYIFRGPSGCGKATTGRVFARYLLCSRVSEGKSEEPCGQCPSCVRFSYGTHPDFFDVGKDQRTIKIEDSHQMIEDSMKKPFLASRKVFLLRNVENMTREASNALLKALEEPPPSTCFILTSSNPAAVPDTVISRCQSVPFRPLPVKALVHIISGLRDVTPDEAIEAARFAAGSVEKALLLLDARNGLRGFATLLEDALAESPIVQAERYSHMDAGAQTQFLDALQVELEKRLELSLEAQSEETKREAKEGDFRFYRECLLSIMKAKRRLERNVSPFLTFAGLFFELKELSAQEKRSE
ncbi:MAG: DNA polymerase III subunit delta' [Firmicutes bacterium]|nr:DNA polymerase III subunit delta' [Candidatus Fermentithermobacillaceae bacterium]